MPQKAAQHCLTRTFLLVEWKEPLVWLADSPIQIELGLDRHRQLRPVYAYRFRERHSPKGSVILGHGRTPRMSNASKVSVLLLPGFSLASACYSKLS